MYVFIPSCLTPCCYFQISGSMLGAVKGLPAVLSGVSHFTGKDGGQALDSA